MFWSLIEHTHTGTHTHTQLIRLVNPFLHLGNVEESILTTHICLHTFIVELRCITVCYRNASFSHHDSCKLQLEIITEQLLITVTPHYFVETFLFCQVLDGRLIRYDWCGLCTCSEITIYLTALQLSSASFILLQSWRELTVLMRFFSLLTTRRLYKSQPSPIHALVAGGVCTKCQPAH